MDEAERLVRHLEEVAAEIEALKYRLAFLEDHRTDLRKRVMEMMPGRAEGNLIELPRAETVQIHRVRAQRPAQALSLQQAATAVAEIGGAVDAETLSKHMQISFDAARLRLARAARQGLLVRVSLGKYRSATQQPKETLADTSA